MILHLRMRLGVEFNVLKPTPAWEGYYIYY